MRPLPRVHHDDAFWVVDHPGVGRQPTGPLRVGKHTQPPQHAAAASADLRLLDADRTGTNRMDPHAFSAIDRTTSGRSKCTRWPASGTRTAVVPGAPIAPGSSSYLTAAVSASCPPKTKCTGTPSCGR